MQVPTCAQGAALCAAYASYPFDTVRRRLQADAQRPLGERRYKGNLDCLKKVYRVEGVRALFRGAGYNAIRTITSALALVAYGELKKRKRGHIARLFVFALSPLESRSTSAPSTPCIRRVRWDVRGERDGQAQNWYVILRALRFAQQCAV